MHTCSAARPHDAYACYQEAWEAELHTYTHSQCTHLGRVCGYVATPILEMDDNQEFELDQEKLMLACVCGIIAGVAVAYTKANDM